MFLSLSFTLEAQTKDDYLMENGRLDLIKSVQVYPNPAFDFVHIRIDQFPVSNVKLTLHNIIGNEMNVETEVVDDHEIRIRVKDLAAGYYLVALKDDEDKFNGTFKFLKR